MKVSCSVPTALSQLPLGDTFTVKKEPHLPEYPKWILTKKTKFQTPRYHFLLPVCTDHSVLSSDSLSGRIRSLLTAGPRSVLLTVSCFHTDCLQVISFLPRCFLSPTGSSLQCVGSKKVLSCSSHLNVKLLNSCHYSLFFSFVNSLCLYFLYIFYI